MFEVTVNEHEEKNVEMVERKGLGHPDSLADGLAEAVSRALSKKYREKLGFIAHHNTDEVQIIGGQSKPEFENGTLKKPIYVLLGGRATQSYGGKEFNVHGIAIKAAREYLDSTLRHIDVEQDVIIDSRIGEGSPDLTEMYSRSEEIPLANDTSFGIGHYPYTKTEKVVMEVEKHLNSDEVKEEMPWIGEDVKVMANRKKDELEVTVAAAFVSSEVEGIDDYVRKKEETVSEIEEIVGDLYDGDYEVNLNTADHPEKGSVYLTVTGTSAEMGDDGSTGRGNRTNGLITPFNPMSLEATSGKNPVAHVGKIYNVLSRVIAKKIVENFEDVESATLKILSQIGKPINEPQMVSVELEGTLNKEDISDEVEDICQEWLDRTPEVMERVIEGEITTF